MDQGDIIQITDVQQLAGYTKEILNVYQYKVVTLTDTVPLQVYAEELVNAWWEFVGSKVLNIQSSALVHVRVELLNLSNQTEIGDRIWDTPIAGLAPGDYMPGNLTYSFRLQRYSRVVRNGRKSIAGVTDGAVQQGRIPTADVLPLLSTLATALGTFFPVEGETTDATLIPMIVRKPANPGVVPTVFSPVTKAYFRGFGTMNTRKAL